MPLTPEDVRNKQFTTVRLREGYDEDEVDAFLDEVEAELTRLLRENDELRAKLAAATRVAAAGGPSPIDRKEDIIPAPSAPPAAAGQGSDGAARVLAMAQQTADQAIAEARNEANKIVTEARAKAEAVERDSRARAEALERDAADKHRAAMGSLDQQRQILERKVEDLRQFEREYRSRLRSYLEGQLRQLESQSDEQAGPRTAGQPVAAGAPQQRGGSAGAAAGSGPMRGFIIDEEPDS
ncbi:MAG: DivIVA domain-containing protein [Actinomycetes bacterium]|jgi:DivIVA domain-containing protein